MFYSQFILAKKGPLGTIWIAAHLERKLRKNQVADTNIGVSVDSILFPEAPIALRLSSHLLLGVVRIYSKKVNYLFDDCSEALLKIKQAFRSTAVDLPPEESTAPYHTITLPETLDLDDFEIPDTDVLRGNYVDHHVSAKEQITLRESIDGAVFSTTKFGLDERFGDGDASHVPLDFEEDLLLGKIASPFDETAEIDSVLSNPSDVFVGNTVDKNKEPDDEAQAPSTPGLVSEPNIVTAQNGRDAASEENYILEENEGAEIMNVDTNLKLPEHSDCSKDPESVLIPEYEPVNPFSESEVIQSEPISDPEIEPVKSHSEPEIEPVNALPILEVEPVKILSDADAEPAKLLSDPETENVKLLSSSITESGDSLSEPETEPAKTHYHSEDSPVEPMSLVSNTTPATVSGRSRSAKRKFLERLDSVEITETTTTPNDDCLLSTILGGRRSSVVTKRTASQELSSRKRAKSTPRVSTLKRKVLVDDSMGLLGDTIRKQLRSTADIRRLRKKAPCTLAEIVAVERLLIHDELFGEAVFSGTASDLRNLHFDKFDLSAVIVDDILRDEVPDCNENQEGKDDKIFTEEEAYHGGKCADDANFGGREQECECIDGKSGNPENSSAITALDECGTAEDLNSTANRIPALNDGKERTPIDGLRKESMTPEPQQLEEIGDSCAPVDKPNEELAIPVAHQAEEIGNASIDEPNEGMTIPEPSRVQVGIAVDEAGIASINVDVVGEDNGEILEDNFTANNTEFLTIDDDDNGEDDADEGEPLDNSGWSIRTRAVANYLQQLFNKETKYERNGVAVDALLMGKTSKEASRMFFETLVLKTKDYIQVEQGNPYDRINIEPRLRLMKSEF